MYSLWTEKHSVMKKAICLVVALAFFIDLVLTDAWAAIDTGKAPYAITEPEPVSFSRFDVETFTVPAHLGDIKYSCKGTSDRFVIHIQDAHCNCFAQRKVSDLIDYISKEYGVRIVNLEGGVGDYDLEVFTSISGEAVRREVADYFVKKGEVNGAEYYAINNPGRVRLWGVEDKDLYLANLKVYRDSLTYRKEIERRMKVLDHILNNLKTKIYTPQLLEIDMAYNAYKAGNMDFRDYLEFLLDQARKNKVDIRKFNNVDLLARALEQEEDVDFKEANAERNHLIEFLKKGLSRNEVRRLIQKTVDFKTKKVSRKEFYGYLLDQAKGLGLDISKYPALANYVAYVTTFEGVDRSKIMAELDGLEAAVKEPLYSNDTQRELDGLSRNLALLKNIFGFTLTKEDYAFYLANRGSFDMVNYVRFIEKEAPKYKISARPDPGIVRLDDYREKTVKFYEYSFERDKVFLSNLKFAPAAEGMKGALLMTGGFHTENLCELLEEKDVSYVSILPKFRIEEGYESPYFDMLAGQVSDIQRMLRSVLARTAMLQIASMLNSLGDDVWGPGNIAAFRAAVRIQAMVRSGDKVVLVNMRDEVLRADGRECVWGEGIERKMTVAGLLSDIGYTPEEIAEEAPEEEIEEEEGPDEEGPAVTAIGSYVAAYGAMIAANLLAVGGILMAVFSFGMPLMAGALSLLIGSSYLVLMAQGDRAADATKGFERAATPEDSLADIWEKFGPALALPVWAHERVHKVTAVISRLTRGRVLRGGGFLDEALAYSVEYLLATPLALAGALADRLLRNSVLRKLMAPEVRDLEQGYAINAFKEAVGAENAERILAIEGMDRAALADALGSAMEDEQEELLRFLGKLDKDALYEMASIDPRDFIDIIRRTAKNRAFLEHVSRLPAQNIYELNYLQNLVIKQFNVLEMAKLMTPGGMWGRVRRAWLGAQIALSGFFGQIKEKRQAVRQRDATSPERAVSALKESMDLQTAWIARLQAATGEYGKDLEAEGGLLGRQFAGNQIINLWGVTKPILDLMIGSEKEFARTDLALLRKTLALLRKHLPKKYEKAFKDPMSIASKLPGEYGSSVFGENLGYLSSLPDVSAINLDTIMDLAVMAPDELRELTERTRTLYGNISEINTLFDQDKSRILALSDEEVGRLAVSARGLGARMVRKFIDMKLSLLEVCKKADERLGGLIPLVERNVWGEDPEKLGKVRMSLLEAFGGSETRENIYEMDDRAALRWQANNQDDFAQLPVILAFLTGDSAFLGQRTGRAGRMFGEPLQAKVEGMGEDVPRKAIDAESVESAADASIAYAKRNWAVVDLIAEVIRRRDVSAVIALDELREQYEARPNEESTRLVLQYLAGDSRYRNKIEIATLLSGWGAIHRAAPENDIVNAASGTINEALRGFLAGDIGEGALRREISRAVDAAKKDLIRHITGTELPGNILNDKALMSKLMVMVSLYYSIPQKTVDFEEKEKMPEKIAEALRRFISYGGDVAVLEKWILEETETNRHEIDSLEALGYDRSLWEKGVVVEGFASTGLTAEGKQEQLVRHTHQLVEIAKLIGAVDEQQMEEIRLGGYEDAAAFVEENILSQRARALENVSEEEYEQHVANAEMILGDFMRLAGAQETAGEQEQVTIVIRKNFIEEANAGVGVPGCFNPLTGIHREMPVMHGLEANAFFAIAYDSSGRQVANVVLALTDKGMVVFGDYSRSPYDLNPLWAEAWKELARVAPSVILSETSAGRSDSEGLGARRGVTATRNASEWEDPYFDFGETDEDGETKFEIKDAVILTEESIEDNGGYDRSRQIAREWDAIRASREKVEVKTGRAEKARFDAIGKALAGDERLKPYLFVIGSIKRSGIPLDEISREDIREWLEARGQVPDAVVDSITAVVAGRAAAVKGWQSFVATAVAAAPLAATALAITGGVSSFSIITIHAVFGVMALLLAFQTLYAYRAQRIYEVDKAAAPETALADIYERFGPVLGPIIEFHENTHKAFRRLGIREGGFLDESLAYGITYLASVPLFLFSVLEYARDRLSRAARRGFDFDLIAYNPYESSEEDNAKMLNDPRWDKNFPKSGFSYDAADRSNMVVFRHELERSGEKVPEKRMFVPETILGERGTGSGSYRIVEDEDGNRKKLGSGGFALVMQGVALRGPAEGENVAIKILDPDASETSRLKFFQEYLIMGMLDGIDGVVGAYDAGYYEVNNKRYYYMVQELVEGGTLAEKISERKEEMKLPEGDPARRKTVFTMEESLDLALQLLRALNAIHGRGIIHADIKPHNILLEKTPDGSLKIKIADFGLAMYAPSGEIRLKTSRVGTTPYSPKATLIDGLVNLRTDIYSLGLVLYQVSNDGVLPHDYLIKELEARIKANRTTKKGDKKRKGVDLRDMAQKRNRIIMNKLVWALKGGAENTLDSQIAKMLTEDPTLAILNTQQVLDRISSITSNDSSRIEFIRKTIEARERESSRREAADSVRAEAINLMEETEELVVEDEAESAAEEAPVELFFEGDVKDDEGAEDMFVGVTVGEDTVELAVRARQSIAATVVAGVITASAFGALWSFGGLFAAGAAAYLGFGVMQLVFQSMRAAELQRETGAERAAGPEDEYTPERIRRDFGPRLAPFVRFHENRHRALLQRGITNEFLNEAYAYGATFLAAPLIGLMALGERVKLKAEEAARRRGRSAGNVMLVSVARMAFLFAVVTIAGCVGIGGERVTTYQRTAPVPVEEKLPETAEVRNLQSNPNWQPVRAADTGGVTGVDVDKEGMVLRAICDIEKAPDKPHKGQGEIMIDVRYGRLVLADGTVLKGQLDMTGGEIKIALDLPAGFTGPPDARSGVQIAVVSETGSQYSKWRNARRGRIEIKFNPSNDPRTAGWTDKGFDPSKINAIKIKFALSGAAPRGYKFTGPITVGDVSVTGKKAEEEAPGIEPPAPEPVVSAHRRDSPITVEKPGLRSFLEWSGISEYTAPSLYGKEVLTEQGFKGISGEMVEEQYREMDKVREEIGRRFPSLSRLSFTDRRFLFCDLSNGLTTDDEGNLAIDHDLARANIAALMDLARRHNMKLVPVLFDYRLFHTHPEFGLDAEKRKELIALITPELKLLGANKDVVKAIEPVNEPDVDYNEDEKFLVTGIDPETGQRTYVPLSMRQQFVADLAQAIRTHAGTPVSFSAVSREFSKFWLHLLQKGDVLNIHYYTKASYTGEDVRVERGLDPETSGLGWLNVPPGVTVIYGEIQPSDGEGRSIVKQNLDVIRKGGYQGALAWWVEKDFLFKKAGCADDLAAFVTGAAREEGVRETPQKAPEVVQSLLVNIFSGRLAPLNWALRLLATGSTPIHEAGHRLAAYLAGVRVNWSAPRLFTGGIMVERATPIVSYGGIIANLMVGGISAALLLYPFQAISPILFVFLMYIAAVNSAAAAAELIGSYFGTGDIPQRANIPENLDLDPFGVEGPEVWVSPRVINKMTKLVRAGHGKSEYGLLLFGKGGRITDFVEVPPGRATNIDLRTGDVDAEGRRVSRAIVKGKLEDGYEFYGYFHNHPSSEEVRLTGRDMMKEDIFPSRSDMISFFLAHTDSEIFEEYTAGEEYLMGQRIEDLTWGKEINDIIQKDRRLFEFIGGRIVSEDGAERIAIGAHEAYQYRTREGGYATLYTYDTTAIAVTGGVLRPLLYRVNRTLGRIAAVPGRVFGAARGIVTGIRAAASVVMLTVALMVGAMLMPRWAMEAEDRPVKAPVPVAVAAEAEREGTEKIEEIEAVEVPGLEEKKVSAEEAARKQAMVDGEMEKMAAHFDAIKNRLKDGDRELLSGVLDMIRANPPRYVTDKNFPHADTERGFIGLPERNLSDPYMIRTGAVHEALHHLYKKLGMDLPEEPQMSGFSKPVDFWGWLEPGEEGWVIRTTNRVMRILDENPVKGMKMVYMPRREAPVPGGIVVQYDGKPVSVDEIVELAKAGGTVMEKRQFLVKLLPVLALNGGGAGGVVNPAAPEDSRKARQALDGLFEHYKEATRKSFQAIKDARGEPDLKATALFESPGAGAMNRLSEAFNRFHNYPDRLTAEDRLIIRWWADYRLWNTVSRSIQMYEMNKEKPRVKTTIPLPGEEVVEPSPFGMADLQDELGNYLGKARYAAWVGADGNVHFDDIMNVQTRQFADWNRGHENIHLMLDRIYPGSSMAAKEVAAVALAFRYTGEVEDGHLKALLTAIGIEGDEAPRDLSDSEFLSGIADMLAAVNPGLREAILADTEGIASEAQRMVSALRAEERVEDAREMEFTRKIELRIKDVMRAPIKMAPLKVAPAAERPAGSIETEMGIWRLVVEVAGNVPVRTIGDMYFMLFNAALGVIAGIYKFIVDIVLFFAHPIISIRKFFSFDVDEEKKEDIEDRLKLGIVSRGINLAHIFMHIVFVADTVALAILASRAEAGAAVAGTNMLTSMSGPVMIALLVIAGAFLALPIARKIYIELKYPVSEEIRDLAQERMRLIFKNLNIKLSPEREQEALEVLRSHIFYMHPKDARGVMGAVGLSPTKLGYAVYIHPGYKDEETLKRVIDHELVHFLQKKFGLIRNDIPLVEAYALIQSMYENKVTISDFDKNAVIAQGMELADEKDVKKRNFLAERLARRITRAGRPWYRVPLFTHPMEPTYTYNLGIVQAGILHGLTREKGYNAFVSHKEHMRKLAALARGDIDRAEMMPYRPGISQLKYLATATGYLMSDLYESMRKHYSEKFISMGELIRAAALPGLTVAEVFLVGAVMPVVLLVLNVQRSLAFMTVGLIMPLRFLIKKIRELKVSGAGSWLDPAKHPIWGRWAWLAESIVSLGIGALVLYSGVGALVPFAPLAAALAFWTPHLFFDNRGAARSLTVLGLAAGTYGAVFLAAASPWGLLAIPALMLAHWAVNRRALRIPEAAAIEREPAEEEPLKETVVATEALEVKAVGDIDEDKRQNIANGTAAVLDRLLEVSGMKGERRVTVQVGGSLLDSGVKTTEDGGLFVLLTPVSLKRARDTSGMTEAEKTADDIAFMRGDYDDDLDERKLAFILGHELAHMALKRNFFYRLVYMIAPYFGPAQRFMEYSSDRLAARYMRRMGISDVADMVDMSLNVFKLAAPIGGLPLNVPTWAQRLPRRLQQLYLWFTQTHPTPDMRVERIRRMAPWLAANVAPVYASRSFREMAVDWARGEDLGAAGWPAEAYFDFLRGLAPVSALERSLQDLSPLEKQRMIEFHDNVYIRTTEPDWAKGVEAARKATEGRAPGVYVGTSSSYPMFSQLAGAEFSRGVIIDFNPYVTEVLLPMMFSFMAETGSRAEFLARLAGVRLNAEETGTLKDAPLADVLEKVIEKIDEAESNPGLAEIMAADRQRIWEEAADILPEGIRENAKKFWDDFMFRRIAQELRTMRFTASVKTPGDEAGWLYDEKNFGKIRGMVRGGRILAVTGDWSSPEFMSSVRRTLEGHRDETGEEVTTVYTSNLHEWLFRDMDPNDVKAFLDNLRSLPSSERAVFIRQSQLFATRNIKGTEASLISSFRAPDTDAAAHGVFPHMFDAEGRPVSRVNRLGRTLFNYAWESGSAAEDLAPEAAGELYERAVDISSYDTFFLDDKVEALTIRITSRKMIGQIAPGAEAVRVGNAVLVTESEAGKIGKLVKREDIDVLREGEQITHLRVKDPYDPDRRERNVSLVKSDIREFGYAIRSIKAMAPSADNWVLDVFLGLLEKSPPELYFFYDIVGDLMGYATAEAHGSAENGFIAISDRIFNNPVALVHEVGEYLIDAGVLKVEISGRDIVVFSEGTEAGRIKDISYPALSQAMKEPGSPHYALRALQREVFDHLDKALTRQIKIELLAERLRAGFGGETWSGMPGGLQGPATGLHDFIQARAQEGDNGSIEIELEGKKLTVRPGDPENRITLARADIADLARRQVVGFEMEIVAEAGDPWSSDPDELMSRMEVRHFVEYYLERLTRSRLLGIVRNATGDAAVNIEDLGKVIYITDRIGEDGRQTIDIHFPDSKEGYRIAFAVRPETAWEDITGVLDPYMTEAVPARGPPEEKAATKAPAEKERPELPGAAKRVYERLASFGEKEGVEPVRAEEIYLAMRRFRDNEGPLRDLGRWVISKTNKDLDLVKLMSREEVLEAVSSFDGLDLLTENDWERIELEVLFNRFPEYAAIASTMRKIESALNDKPLARSHVTVLLRVKELFDARDGSLREQAEALEKLRRISTTELMAEEALLILRDELIWYIKNATDRLKISAINTAREFALLDRRLALANVPKLAQPKGNIQRKILAAIEGALGVSKDELADMRKAAELKAGMSDATNAEEEFIDISGLDPEDDEVRNIYWRHVYRSDEERRDFMRRVNSMPGIADYIKDLFGRLYGDKVKVVSIIVFGSYVYPLDNVIRPSDIDMAVVVDGDISQDGLWRKKTYLFKHKLSSTAMQDIFDEETVAEGRTIEKVDITPLHLRDFSDPEARNPHGPFWLAYTNRFGTGVPVYVDPEYADPFRFEPQPGAILAKSAELIGKGAYKYTELMQKNSATARTGCSKLIKRTLEGLALLHMLDPELLEKDFGDSYQKLFIKYLAFLAIDDESRWEFAGEFFDLFTEHAAKIMEWASDTEAMAERGVTEAEARNFLSAIKGRVRDFAFAMGRENPLDPVVSEEREIFVRLLAERTGVSAEAADLQAPPAAPVTGIPEAQRAITPPAPEAAAPAAEEAAPVPVTGKLQAGKEAMGDYRQGVADWIVTPMNEMAAAAKKSIDSRSSRFFRKTYNSDTFPEGYVYSAGQSDDQFRKSLKKTLLKVLSQIQSKEFVDKKPRAIVFVPEERVEIAREALDEVLAELGLKALADRFNIVKEEDVPANGMIDDVFHAFLGKDLLNYERFRKGDYGPEATFGTEARMRLARFLKTLVDDPAAIDLDKDPELLAKILDGVVALRMRPVNYEKLRDWKEAQNEVLRSL